AGPTAAGEQRQAEVLDWQLEVAAERGVAGTCLFSWTDEWWVGDSAVDGWHFGLTHADRRPRPALEVAARHNRRRPRDLRPSWPSLSVVICAYNAAETLDECLRHTCALDYPGLEIVVVDDGSTDDTARIARAHPRARLLTIPHAGLSTARNQGFRAATGEVVAYLDSDAYPTPEWPYYLALALDEPAAGAAGGPNLPPLDDPVGAQVVARSPGGPVHVLTADDRAEHVPGCNMVFRRSVLEEVGGFDPVYTAAGDDVDLCWKVLDRGWDIAFHPAALVWHHRRPGLRRYLRQQSGYGRAEALVQVRHPARFSATGTARWSGRIYNSLVPSFARSRIYRGPYATAAYQSVYQGGGYAIDLAHQVGVPVAAGSLLTAPLALVHPLLGLGAAAGLALVAALALVDVCRAQPPRDLRDHRFRFRLDVAVHHLLQPLVRTWARWRAAPTARRELPPVDGLPIPTVKVGATVVLPQDGARADTAATLVDVIRRAGVPVSPPTGWEDHDGRLPLSSLVTGDLMTSSHTEGCLQVRIRSRLRPVRAALALVLVAVLALTTPPLAAAGLLCIAAETARGLLEGNRLLPAVLGRPSSQSTSTLGIFQETR
ncbi:MAG: glycosyltransferase family 2 protein, partial [Actinomycetota bacterium]|nr:glycosyltransferase family 2 protein [Actinomycetota bacterium]